MTKFVEYKKDIQYLTKKLNIKSYYVLGHSMGAGIAINIAAYK